MKGQRMKNGNEKKRETKEEFTQIANKERIYRNERRHKNRNKIKKRKQ